MYIHSSLLPEGKIRVLHLHPGKWHDEISCHLTVESLDETSTFEALSYVWGNPDDTVPVQLDGRPFQVTKNLGAALRRLRKKESDRAIWIDQLCINQADLEEKSRQVALMPQIYKGCKHVFLWLGEVEVVDEITVEDALTGTSHIKGVAEAGMDIIRLFASQKHLQEISCFQVIDGTTLAISPDHAAGFEGMKLITSLPYWDRAWIVQEKILPAKATVILGSSSLPWKSVIAAAKFWSSHVISCCRLLGDSLPLETRNMLLHFFSKIIRVSNIATTRLAAGSCLIDLLRYTRSRKASDDRDKIFSVLGLVNNWLSGTPLKPDYTLTTIELYAMVTQHLINSMNGSLMVLVGNHLRRPDIPSWIPDWAAEDNSDYPYEAGWGEVFYNRYNTSLGQPANLKRHGDLMLLLDGFFVDRIVAAGDPMETHDWKGAVPFFDSWMEITGVAKDGQQPYVAGGNIENALWRCMIGNLVYNGKPMDSQGNQYQKAAPGDFAAYEIWKQEIRTAAEGQWMLSNETLSLQMVVPLTARHRALFVTEKGFFGIGPPSVKAGDNVHVLLGSTVPFVTRQVTSIGNGIELPDPSVKTYSLVGECYVHGIMDGEIVAKVDSRKETLAFC